MVAEATRVKQGWVWLFSILIFFFNTFLLPEGLTYTFLLTPVWIYMLYMQGKLQTIIPFLAFLVFYMIIHLISGVDLVYYFRSELIITGLSLFIILCYFYINNDSVIWDSIFKDIAILNFLLTVIAVCILYFPAINGLLWYKIPVTKNIEIPRLKLFTEEASHYSYLLAPIAIYFYSKALFFKTSNPAITLFIITAPLILSFSLGVIIAMSLSFVLLIILFFNRLFYSRRKKAIFTLSIISIILFFFITYKVYPNHILFTRIRYIFTGEDTSARGRTYEAFILANKIIQQKSLLWGIGPGQLKLIGREIIIQYYSYFNIPQVIRIPNACAETIVCFGYIGFALRLIIEIYLFFKTRVYHNPFRFWLYIFLFIYQFTGSYITNVVEYVMWVICFSGIFAEFNKVDFTSLKTENQ